MLLHSKNIVQETGKSTYIIDNGTDIAQFESKQVAINGCVKKPHCFNTKIARKPTMLVIIPGYCIEVSALDCTMPYVDITFFKNDYIQICTKFTGYLEYYIPSTLA